MIKIGNFFFRYRNALFLFLYALLFIPSPRLFTEAAWGPYFYLYASGLGLLITFSGQLIRGATIGLAYIVRGGRNKEVYADGLVTSGIFSHVRNPLYIGNLLMLWGVGILANSLLFVAVVMPIFFFIYQCIVLAEEAFLRKKFGNDFETYARQVHRWIPQFKGIGKTFSSMRFNWKRWMIKEYNTQFVWLSGIVLIWLINYADPVGLERNDAYVIGGASILLFAVYYFTIRFLKKTGRWKA